MLNDGLGIAAIYDKRSLRSWLRDEYKGRCAYCGVFVGEAGTVDHYIALALGGTNATDNLRWCCSPCNHLKNDMTVDDWGARVQLFVKRAETRREAKIRLLATIPQRKAPNGQS